MTMGNASITLPVADWQEAIKKGEQALERCAQLEAALAEAKQGGADPLIKIILDGFRGAHELVSFLIAHAHPEVVKTQPWPFEALLKFADALETIPLVAPSAAFRQEAAIDMRHMAGEAAHWNRVRAERRAALNRGEVPAIGEVLNPPSTIE